MNLNAGRETVNHCLVDPVRLRSQIVILISDFSLNHYVSLQ